MTDGEKNAPVARGPGRPFTPGNPGRPRGVVNKATREIRAVALRLIGNRKYLQALAVRLRAGEAPHMEVLLHHYAYGKPKERIEVTTYDVTALEVLLVEARNGNGANGHSGPGNGNGGPVIETTATKDS